LQLTRVTRYSIPVDANCSFVRRSSEVVNIMNYEKIYEKILPYLSDPKSIKEFLDEHKGSNGEGLIEEINRLIEKSDVPLKTDLRILLNALEKTR
jgi:hypothetical protein